MSPSNHAGCNRFGSRLKTLIKTSDFALVNFEGPATTSKNPIPKSGPSIKMDPNSTKVVKELGFSGVTLANNHIMDYGEEGLFQTTTNCKELDLKICGAGANAAEALKPIILKLNNGFRIAIFSLCEREFGACTGKSPGSAWISDPQAIKEVSKARNATDFVIVIAHGGIEDVPIPPLSRQEQLKKFIDSGANVVIGHHPHVPQGWEKYNGGYIFYSLGNFIFDYPNGKRHIKTEWGYLVQMNFKNRCLDKIDVILTKQQHNIVECMNEDHDFYNCVKYLQRLCEIMIDTNFGIFWRETSYRIFDIKYKGYIEYICGPKLLRQSAAMIAVRIKYKILSNFKNDSNRKYLLLLNLLRNESHSCVMKNFVETYSEEISNSKNLEIKKEVEQLMKWTTE